MTQQGFLDNLQPIVEVVHQTIGRRMSPQTVVRWCRKGIGGARLKHLKVGGRLYSKPDWVEEFILASNGDSDLAEEECSARRLGL